MEKNMLKKVLGSPARMVSFGFVFFGLVILCYLLHGCASTQSMPTQGYDLEAPAATEATAVYDSPVVKLYYMNDTFCSGVILSNNEIVTSNYCLHNKSVSRINDDGEMRILSEKESVGKSLGSVLVDTTNNRIPPNRVHSKLTEGLVVTVRGYGCATIANGTEAPSDKTGEIINYNARTGVFDVLSLHTLCPGDSGAAVYTQTGKLVGVVSSKIETPTNSFSAYDVSWQRN